MFRVVVFLGVVFLMSCILLVFGMVGLVSWDSILIRVLGVGRGVIGVVLSGFDVMGGSDGVGGDECLNLGCEYLESFNVVMMVVVFRVIWMFWCI